MIFDEHDQPVAPGVVGEIVCRPKFPNVMFEGYWNRPEATAAAWRNMWMHTGDLGRMDEDNWVYFVDRAKDYLRRSGENVSSFQVEALFMTHGDLTDVAVHGIAQDGLEDEIKLTAVVRNGSIWHILIYAYGQSKSCPISPCPVIFEFSP